MPEKSIGRVRGYFGNFLVVVKALTYIMTLGKEGISQAAKHAVLNANYMMAKLKSTYDMAYDGICIAFVGMHPTLRQVPPSLSFSIKVTAAPSCAALIAATYPPGPPPITATVFAPCHNQPSLWRKTGFLAAPTSSSLPTGVVTGAACSASGSLFASSARLIKPLRNI